MKKIWSLFCSISRPTWTKAIRLKRTVFDTLSTVTKRNSNKNYVEIYGDRVRQYHIRRIQVVNRSGTRHEFSVVQNTPDGNCLFRAISQAIFKNEGNHAAIRKDVVNYITGSDRWKDYFPYIRGQHEHLSRKRTRLLQLNNGNPFHGNDPDGTKVVEIEKPGPSVSSSKPSAENIEPANLVLEDLDLKAHWSRSLLQNCSLKSGVGEHTGQKHGATAQVTATTDSLTKGNDTSPSVMLQREPRQPLTCDGITFVSSTENMAEQKEPENNNNNIESEDSDEERELLRQEYKRYMLTEKAYGTLQELVAAAQFFQFNLVVFREIPTGSFNVQTFCENKYDVTYCFLFTGHQEDGHFELMDSDGYQCHPKRPLEVLNGSYVQVNHSPKEGLVTIQDESSRNRSCGEPRASKTKSGKGEKSKILTNCQSKPSAAREQMTIVEILPPSESHQALKNSSSFSDIPCRMHHQPGEVHDGQILQRSQQT